MFFLFPLALALPIAATGERAWPEPISPAPSARCGRPASLDRAPPLWLAAQIGAVPSAAQPVAPAREGGPLELWRAADGLFYVDGAINGHIVRFVVDTGASMVVLTASDARRAGVTTDRDAPTLEAQTATGTSIMTRVTLASMQVGNTGVAAAPAAIAPDGLGVSLLGQSWLSHLGSVTIEGDRMTLR